MVKKVFELAKELNLAPLDLVEGLKQKGFTIRNHMTDLTSDEVEKVFAIYRPSGKDDDNKKPKVAGIKKKVKTLTKKETPEVEAAPAPVIEKTITKKSAEVIAPKEVAEEVALVSAAPEVKTEAAPDEASADDKNDPSKKKGVILRRSQDAGTSVNKDSLSEKFATMYGESGEDGKPRSGLRVVSRPAAAAATGTNSDIQSKDHYQEKVHRFTPVYVPPKGEKVETTDKTQTHSSILAPSKKSMEALDLNEASGEAGKNRLGGLASMMSKPRSSLTRSQQLLEDRAEEELKSYGTLNILGRPLYVNVGRKKAFSGHANQTIKTEVKENKRVLELHKGATCEDLAYKLKVKFTELADKVLKLNLLIKPTDFIGMQLAAEIANLFDYRVEDVAFDEKKIIDQVATTEAKKESATSNKKSDSTIPVRPPIVTIMGHVDHGKTTLLDTIRKAKVAQGEAGGITQHIGAYTVKVNDKVITFLDTPGHEAFASMRQRGANVTDVVVLVVAADDGVMPQTRESIKFCKIANVPLIIAVNKMDKEGVNPDKIKQALMEFEITPEEWGGDTQFVPISALKGTGIDNLLEAISLQADVMELRANDKGACEGIVIESKIEIGRGPVATILVQKGTLVKGDSIVVGECYGRARSLLDDSGANIDEAGPSIPVQVLGLDNPPSPGDVVNVVKSEREAKKIVDNRIAERKELAAQPEKAKMSLEDFFANSGQPDEETKKLNLIIRTDVNGSYEAIKQSLEALSNSEVQVKLIGGGVGAINDNDVLMAMGSKAYIIGFNMRPVTSARRMAEEKGVDVKNYSIIYDLINDIKLAAEGLLESETFEKYLGRAEVRETFVVPKIGTIAGSAVIDGKILRGCNIRLLRDGKIIFDGKLSSLKRFKDDAKEVASGYECGIGLEGYNDIRVNDIFEAYMMEEKKRTLADVAKKDLLKTEAAATTV
jgi:translation initiation factor IF-2